MKALNLFLLSGSLCVAAASAGAQDTMKKGDTMTKPAMTMEQCKDHMAMSKKAAAKKDDASMKMDEMCADMMKGDGMKKDSMMMKHEGTASAPMAK